VKHAILGSMRFLDQLNRDANRASLAVQEASASHREVANSLKDAADAATLALLAVAAVAVAALAIATVALVMTSE
jgi:hypothetical protein